MKSTPLVSSALLVQIALLAQRAFQYEVHFRILLFWIALFVPSTLLVLRPISKLIIPIIIFGTEPILSYIKDPEIPWLFQWRDEIVFFENRDCIPWEPRFCSQRTKIVIPENPDCVPGEQRLCSRRTEIVFPENLDCIPGEPRLCSWRTEIVFPENLDCVPGEPLPGNRKGCRAV